MMPLASSIPTHHVPMLGMGHETQIATTKSENVWYGGKRKRTRRTHQITLANGFLLEQSNVAAFDRVGGEDDCATWSVAMPIALYGFIYF